LLTISIVLGVLTSVRFESRQWPRYVTEGLHRNISLLILVFIALHVATTVGDGFAPIGYLDAIIPFSSPYRTVWLGLGAVALDLLLALAITSVLRVRIGYTSWRYVHWLAYVSWPVAMMHGLGTGSDATTPWLLGVSLVSLVAVLGVVAWRIAQSWNEIVRYRWAAVTAAIAVPLAIAIWAQQGPLAPGWSHSFRAKKPVVHQTASNAQPSSAQPTNQAAAK